MTTSQPDEGRYSKVRVTLDGSNVRTVTLTACRDCGAYIYSRYVHDKQHALAHQPNEEEVSPGTQ